MWKMWEFLFPQRIIWEFLVADRVAFYFHIDDSGCIRKFFPFSGEMTKGTERGFELNASCIRSSAEVPSTFKNYLDEEGI